MITRPTVLILGAGASCPYGYPLGRGLVGELTANFDALPSNQQRDWLVAAGFTKEHHDEFARTLRASNQDSIDAFLEHQPDFREIGKFRLAHILLNCENEHWLHTGRGSDDLWYRYLINKMDATFGKLNENQLSVVTFNYDRSFEHFLYLSLRHRYPVDADEVAKVVAGIPMVHIHGSFGPLDWQKSDGRPYEPAQNPDDIKRAAREIKIISEASSDTIELKRAEELVRAADRVYFLGFAYHRTNVERLSVPWDDAPRRRKKFWGSSFGLTDAEVNLLGQQNKGLECGEGRFRSFKCLEFLRNVPVQLE